LIYWRSFDQQRALHSLNTHTHTHTLRETRRRWTSRGWNHIYSHYTAIVSAGGRGGTSQGHKNYLTTFSRHYLIQITSHPVLIRSPPSLRAAVCL